MLAGYAVTAILMMFSLVWALRMALNPKHWRFWWMRHLGYPDISYNQQQRRSQENLLRLVSFLLFGLFSVVATACVYGVILEIRERERQKTDYERDQDDARRTLDEMRSTKEFRRLK